MAGTQICKACGYAGDSKSAAPSSLGVEILVWIVALVLSPFTLFISIAIALGFSIWRLASKYRACAKCGSKDLIPLDSPIGRQLAEQSGAQAPASTPKV